MKTKQIILMVAIVLVGIANFWLWKNGGLVTNNKPPEYNINQQIDPTSKDFENWKNSWDKQRLQ